MTDLYLWCRGWMPLYRIYLHTEPLHVITDMAFSSVVSRSDAPYQDPPSLRRAGIVYSSVVSSYVIGFWSFVRINVFDDLHWIHWRKKPPPLISDIVCLSVASGTRYPVSRVRLSYGPETTESSRVFKGEQLTCWGRRFLFGGVFGLVPTACDRPRLTEQTAT